MTPRRIIWRKVRDRLREEFLYLETFRPRIGLGRNRQQEFWDVRIELTNDLPLPPRLRAILIYKLEALYPDGKIDARLDGFRHLTLNYRIPSREV